MLRTITNALALAILLGGTTALRASAQDELRDKARAIQAEAAALESQGKPVAADRLRRKAQELLTEADRRETQARHDAPQPDIEREVAHLK